MSRLPAYDRLVAALSEIVDLRGIGFLLVWDRSTYMPPGGGAARARQEALLRGLVHERLASPELARLLERAEKEVGALPPDRREAATVRVARREVDAATRLPPGYATEAARHFADAYAAWARAREDGDVRAVVPHLERTLDLSRRKSDAAGRAGHPMDPLIDESDPGATVATLRPLFDAVRAELVPLMRETVAAGAADVEPLRGSFPVDAQRAWALDRVARLGYDLRRGRLDETHHPFAIESSIDDVRITTRFDARDPGLGLFASLHEAGHGMYHQGLDPALETSVLADGASAGVHESQSRMIENVIGRGRPFWEGAYPSLRAAFPAALGDVTLDRFLAAVRRVRPGPIRIRADEVSYDLHVLIRFDLECAMLEGRLEVRDLEEAWNARYEADLGVAPRHAGEGVLQDVHWFSREIGGAFQGYTLGNLLASQVYATLKAEHPGVEDEIRAERYETVHTFLRDRIHRHGRAETPDALIRRVTGRSLEVGPYLTRLRARYAGGAASG